jgi:hypothetical protein
MQIQVIIMKMCVDMLYQGFLIIMHYIYIHANSSYHYEDALNIELDNV